MDLTEDELVATLRRVLSGRDPRVLVGPGDDAAVVESGAGNLVLTTDMLVEGVHFDRSITSARDLGYKSIAVNVSDVAAMAASPRYAMASLALSEAVDSAWVVELYGGMLEASAEYALSLVGGDLSRADRVVVAVAVTGEVASHMEVRRGGARVGDAIVVTGALGAAAAGLLLARAEPPRVASALGEAWAHGLLRAHFRPVARVGEGQTLAQAGATAMMDISDGLALDLSRLCSESDVGARVRVGTLPVAEGVREAAALLGADPLQLVLSGGEDYELLATLDAGAVEGARRELDVRFGVGLTVVGEIIQEGLVEVGEDGHERRLEPKGWDHFDRN